MRRTASVLAAAVLCCEALFALFVCGLIVCEWVVGRSEFEGLHLRVFALALCWSAMCFWAARNAVRRPKSPSAAHRWGLLVAAAAHLGLAVPLTGFRNWLLGAAALLMVLGVQRLRTA